MLDSLVWLSRDTQEKLAHMLHSLVRVSQQQRWMNQKTLGFFVCHCLGAWDWWSARGNMETQAQHSCSSHLTTFGTPKSAALEWKCCVPVPTTAGTNIHCEANQILLDTSSFLTQVLHQPPESQSERQSSPAPASSNYKNEATVCSRHHQKKSVGGVSLFVSHSCGLVSHIYHPSDNMYRCYC